MRERIHPQVARVGEGPVVVVASAAPPAVTLRTRLRWVASPDGAGVRTMVPVKLIVSVKK
jgi:hypothetical protein